MAVPGLPDRASSAIIPEIVEQHAEEAAFLWCLRDVATDQPHYALRHLADLEERVEAHLDGLRIAGLAGIQIARAQLEMQPGMGELFTLATLELEQRNDVGINDAVRVAQTAPSSQRGLFGAIGWVSPESLRGRAAAWLDSRAAFQRLLGVVACSLHRVDPGTRLDHLLNDEPLVRARTLRLVGELCRVDLKPQILSEIASADKACRFWAAWSAGLLGERALAIPVLQEFAVGDTRFKWRALDVLVRVMVPQAVGAWLRELGHNPSNTRLLVVAAGIVGDPIVVPWLLEKMRVPDLARVAAESFSMITGLDLADQKLDGIPPEGFVAGPTDEPLDENIAMDLDENLAWPDPARVETWWQKEGGHFTGGMRHLAGRPLTREACLALLSEGYQRGRRAAAHELALMVPRYQLVNWRATAKRQLAAYSRLKLIAR